MRARNKSFLEDIFILLVIGVIIYVIYNFLFSSDEKTEIVNNTTIETKFERNTNNESISIEKEKVIPEEMDKSINESQKEDSVQIENISKDPDKDTTVVEENMDLKEIVKPINHQTGERPTIELFYKNIEEKIYTNIEKNIDRNLIKNGELIDIKLTILKDGRYEQLTFVDGNKEYFNLIKDSILQVFPVKINESLKEDFPRYFRMEIKIK